MAFMSGILLGVILGLFFASYLVKIGRIGGRKAKNSIPPSKDFIEVVNNKEDFDKATLRTGSTQSGSD